MIFCEDDDVASIQEQVKDIDAYTNKKRVIYHNERDISKLRKLDSAVVIITDLDLIRGVDYKTEDPKGLALMVHRKPPSLREFKQLLGRVGR